DVWRVLLERRNHGDSAGLTQAVERLVLVQGRFEGQAAHGMQRAVRDQPAHAVNRPARRPTTDARDIDAWQQLRVECVQGRDERPHAFSLLEAPEKRQLLDRLQIWRRLRLLAGRTGTRDVWND